MKRFSAALGAFALASCALADIYMAGDSTMCNYNPRQYPQQGWGQGLEWFMKDPAKLHNWAIGGRSARSFKNEGRWQKIVDALKPGDWVIIAFGHNDANRAKTERYSTPEEFKDFMRSFAADVKAKNANVVFATSIPHSGGFSQDGEGNMHVRGGAAGIGPYVQATRELGEELGVPVIDLNKFAEENLPKLGLEAANKFYMRIAPGEYQNHPNGKSDGCHIRDTGAYFYARAAVKFCRDQKLGICEYFKPHREIHFTPIPYGGPGSDAKGPRDDFSAEEIAYANEDGAKDEWKREIMDLRREAERKGMSKDKAAEWAAHEYRRRHK